MFTVRYLVDDRKLGPSLRVLKGLAQAIEPPQPVEGTVIVDGEVREVVNGGLPNPTVRKPHGQIKPTGERLYEKAVAVLVKQGKEEIRSKDLRAAVEKAGGNANSYSYAAAQARERGLLKGPVDGVFTLTKKAFSAMSETSPSRGTTPKRSEPQRLTFKEKVARVKPKLPLSETLPGKVISDLVGRGQTSVNQQQLLSALEMAGGATQSLYYVTVSLQHRNLLGVRSSDGTYTINAAELERLAAAEEGVNS